MLFLKKPRGGSKKVRERAQRSVTGDGADFYEN
jgi:hypothetical protein